MQPAAPHQTTPVSVALSGRAVRNGIGAAQQTHTAVMDVRQATGLVESR